MTSLIGQSLGRYHILEQLGQGGMATVYKAFDSRLDRTVVVKVILQQVRQDAVFIKRFEVEAKTLAQLSHPSIVKILDYGEQDGLPYLVMEYIPGGTLKEKLEQRTPWREAVRLLLPVAEALAHAHSAGIIHRDVKPANVLLSKAGKPLLTDFGIAKLLESEQSPNLTGTGMSIGTPAYASPEQGMGRAVDARTDIYSLGVVFFELITGSAPFSADTPMAVVFKHVHDPLPRPKSLVPDLPDEVERALIKALAKKPEGRFANMQAFVTALENLAQAGAAQATTLYGSAAKPAGRLNLPYAIAGGLVLVLACLMCASSGGLLAVTGWLNSLRGVAPGSAGVAFVNAIQGEVTFVDSTATRRAVTKGAVLISGPNSVLTTAEGQAQLSLSDGTLAYVGPETVVVLTEIGEASASLRLRDGSLLAVVAQDDANGAAGVTIAVPSGARAEAQAATLGVAYDAATGRLDVDCLAGTCRLFDASGQVQQALAAGEHSWLEGTGSPHANDAARLGVWGFAGVVVPTESVPATGVPTTAAPTVEVQATASATRTRAPSATPRPTETETEITSPTAAATATRRPATATRRPPTATVFVPPTATLVPPTQAPTNPPNPPTSPPDPPTDTPIPPEPPTNTPIPS